MSEDSEKLGMKTKIGYGAGAVFNVMCLHAINSYMLIFYHAVVHLSNKNVGLIVLIGRISGGFSTLLVGFFCDFDKHCWIYDRYGKRKVCP